MACKIEGNSEICGPAGAQSVTPMDPSCCPSVGPQCRSTVVVPPMPCTKKQPIIKNPNSMDLWLNRKLVCDNNGSGIQPMGYGLRGRKDFCCTPLSSYQASHGELARKLLTKEICLPKHIAHSPPSMMSNEIMPLCRGYYRPHECLRPQDRVPRGTVAGKPVYPTPFQRYWQAPKPKNRDIVCLAGTNVALSMKVRRRMEGGYPCF